MLRSLDKDGDQVKIVLQAIRSSYRLFEKHLK